MKINKAAVGMNNKRMRELQEEIYSMHGADATNENGIKLRRLQSEYAQELWMLPKEGRQLDQNGFFIPWEKDETVNN